MAQNEAQVESDSHKRTLYSPHFKAPKRACEFVRCDVLCVLHLGVYEGAVCARSVAALWTLVLPPYLPSSERS